MKSRTSRWIAAAGGAAWAVMCVAPALADDTEIFTNLESAAGAKPNVLFVIDTSGSMNEDVTVDKAPYNPATLYADQGCRSARVYYRTGTGSPPSCGSSNWFDGARNHCRAATTALAGIAGAWTGKAAQYNTSNNQWRTLSSSSRDVECEADAGVHGSNSTPTPAVWARNNSSSARWTNVAGQAAPWGAQSTYTFYGSNWLNWYWEGGGGSTVTMTRLEIVQSVSTMVASSIDGVNLGLMRFSSNTTGSNDAAAEGGMVTHEVADIEAARPTIISRLNSYNADGWTPLSETMYEAGQYLRGARVDYGLNSQIRPGTAFPSVPASRMATNQSLYDSPINFKCQKNVVILLTDGEPTQDNSADTKITTLPGYGAATGDMGGTCGEAGWGRCLDEMAGYLFNSDLSPLDGDQNASTYVVGFGDDVAGSPRLDRVATAGGTGSAYEAQNVTQLMVALQDIFRDLLDRNTSFVTPSVAVNAFNRAQTLDDLFVSVFRPMDTLRWPGNLKKYRLENGAIVDANGATAVGADGFFSPGTQSFWSAVADEHLVDVGGARSRLPLPAVRKVYTHIASAGQARLAHPSNALSVVNPGLTDAVLGTGAPGPTSVDVINWTLGFDVRDDDGDGDTTEIARRMGDPLHGRPAVVTYAQTGRDPDKPEKDTVVYLPTNDGLLHAVSGWSDTSTGGGRELWAFTPEELLIRLKDLYANPPTLARTYGLDGDVRVLKFDRNLNGIVEPGDRVILFFGMRRGGNFYYALDVSDRNDPRFLWKMGPGTGANDLPGVGETWSPPALARVNVPGATQNAQRFVLIFGGGYDEIQETYNYTTDAVGNRIYMVDAETGARLWYAGGPGSVGTPDLLLPEMTNSITGRINVIDINGDNFADRLYAADLGGRLWRFDIFNGRIPGPFVTGGIFARFGAGGVAGATIADARRFYYGPDVSLVQRRGEDPYYAIAIGSGYRGHPLHKDTNDYFFVARDKEPFQKLTQGAYDARTPLDAADLVDVTGNVMTANVTAASAGWRIAMQADGPLTGEKVLAESTTVNNVVLFPSYQPSPPDDDTADPCHPQSKNRVYAMRIDNGRPAVNFRDDDPDENDNDDADDPINEDDLFTELGQKDGIVGEVTVGLMRQTNRTVCVAGVEVLSRCVGAGGTVRTFWQRQGD